MPDYAEAVMRSPRALLVDPSTRGGLVAYTRMIARGLHSAGADVAILGSQAVTQHDGDYPILSRMPRQGFGPDRPGRIRLYADNLAVWSRSAPTVMRAARERRADIVHFQHAINKRLDPLLLRLLRRQTTIAWTAHDVLPHECSTRDNALFARIYDAVDVVIVHSEPAAELARELSGVDPVVIEHPATDEAGIIDQRAARHSLELPQDRRVFAALGFIRAYKGYELLARVWEQLGERAPVLLLMGELHSDSEQDVVDRLTRHPNVIARLGYATDDDLHLAIAASDAILLPYTGGSDSGLLHLGRALGTPVIASDTPQLAASVLSTASGLTVPRTVDAWIAALDGALPPPPPAPPSLRETGAAHLEAYEVALSRRSRAARMPAANEEKTTA